jgi:dipeptidyl aminopeptidase/acylaminoacyl peptidase
MSVRKKELIGSVALISLFLVIICLPDVHAQQAKKPFTVADDIGLTLFRSPNGPKTESVLFSPDERYFAVYSQRGRLDTNMVEDSVEFYRSEEVRNFLAKGNGPSKTQPFWVVKRAVKEAEDPFTGEDRAIREWRWLPDSSGMAFLAPAKNGVWQIYLADLRGKKTEVLTPETVSIRFFDIIDRRHYVYVAADVVQKKPDDGPYKVATGHRIGELFFPDDPARAKFQGDSYLWVAIGDKPSEAKSDGHRLAIPEAGFGFALSPDGQTLATVIKPANVPSAWDKLYPPPYPSDPMFFRDAREFIAVDLKTGKISNLVDAPLSVYRGSWSQNDEIENLEWSRDGRFVLLPGTYLKSKENVPSRPCVAVLDWTTKTSTCVEILKGHTETGIEEGYRLLNHVEFVKGQKDKVLVTYVRRDDLGIESTTEYTRTDDSWKVTAQTKGEPRDWHSGLELTIKEDLNQPPTLVAFDAKSSQVIWNPNPQLKSLSLGEVLPYRWKAKAGREVKGNLYKPAGYMAGQRYPLVIQTHGFQPDRFMPAGNYTTGFAAQELAAAGVIVLQAYEACGGTSAPIEERPCAVSVYESAVHQLASEGLVDPEKVGIIGFSRTCSYVMEALTLDSTLHLRAASVNDGYMVDYFQILLEPGPGANDANVGAAPFGEGLQLWLKRSPSFNLDKVTAPLLVMASSGGYRGGGIEMWGPYSGLYSLKKPVDMILLSSSEHGITNPAERMVSQSTNVDWFRFWLQGYEDPDPAKADQYKRWRELKTLQVANDRKSVTGQAQSN